MTFYGPNGFLSSGPFTYLNGLGNSGNFSPHSTTGTLQIEQPITENLRLRAGYLDTASSGLIILDSIVPNLASNTGQTLLSGNGISRYRQFDVTARVRAGDNRELLFSYVRSRATGNLNDFAGYIGSFPYAIIQPNQVATLPTDLPNRFLAWGRVQRLAAVCWDS